MLASNQQLSDDSGIAKVGRPTDFKPEYINQVERFCRVMGTLDTDVAQFFGVCEKTINNWKEAHPEFLQSIKRGKAVVDREVAERLIDRAMGCTVTTQKEVKLKSVEYENGKKVSEEERVEIVTLESTLPPETQAIVFFLKNRRFDLWRDKQEHLHGSDPSNPMPQTVVYLPANGRETKK